MTENREKHRSGGITGRYQATGRGFGFLIPEDGKSREDDFFIPPRCEGGAWHGDTVLAVPSGLDGERRTATVTTVLERANKIVTGALRREGREFWLEPDSAKLPRLVQVVGKVRGARAGDKAAIAVTNYGSAKHPPMGVLRETFGPAGTRAASTAAILYQYEIDREFPDSVLAAAEALPQLPPPEALAGRADLRDKRIITIDGASAKDLDDAVSLERDGQGRWVLGVHIADVSHYVTAGSPLDLEAFERGTSVYFADQVVPMLPKAISNGICSLNPQADRLTLSCTMTIGTDGAVLDHRIERTVIRTAERMTYEDCNLLLSQEEGDRAAQLRTRYAHILPMLEDMAALARVLERSRRLRGSLDLEAGESFIICGPDGTPTDILRRSPGVSEALIESFMLCANECVAEHLAKLQKPAVYRVHEKPTADKAEGLKAMLAPLGIDLQDTGSFGLQKVLDSVRDKPEAPMVHAMVLRAMMKARYDVQNLGHFGLAAQYYCHFTSPIRRYPDLMIHRILTALLAGELEGGREKKLAAAAQRAAVQSSQRELAAQNAEREIEKRYMAEYMAGRLGETFPAAVSGVTKFGLFVTLASGVEGFLPVAALPGGPYRCDELRMTLTGPGGARYSFGMALEVECAAADPASGQVDFVLPGGEKVERAPHPARPDPRPPRRKGGKRSMHVPRGRKRGKRR